MLVGEDPGPLRVYVTSVRMVATPATQEAPTMAVPFLPDPDALAPPGVEDIDPAAELAAVIGPDPDTVARVVDAGPELMAELLANEPDRWRIRDADQAEWAMARLQAARAAMDAIERQHQGYAARIEAWRRRALGDHMADEAFFTAHLLLWGQEQRSLSGGKVKTHRLPSGEVRTTKAGPWRPTIIDPQALLAWALDVRDTGRNMVRSRLLLDVMASALAQHCVVVAGDDEAMVVVDQATGERVPGVAADRTPERAKVVPYEGDDR